MTVNSMAAESSSARCTICARPAQSGDRLCVQCQTAVKRARQVPSLHSELLPRAGASTVASELPRSDNRHAAPVRRAARSALAWVPGGWGIYATLVAFGAAVSITGYLATEKQEEASARERIAQAAQTASAEKMRAANQARGQPLTPSPAESEASPGDEAPAQIEWTLPQQASSAQSRSAPPGRKPARDLRNAGNESPPGVDARRAAEDRQFAPIGVGESGSVARAASAPETQSNPASDRRQLMTAAMARCERENFLAGFVCKERAWLQFCDGQWGEVPQCPGGVAGNNSR